MLLLTVFVTGASVLVIEIIGTRVLAPFFGTGIYTWSALLSVTLAALSTGYWAGGRLADRRPDRHWLSGLCLAAGLWTLLTIPLARFFLPGMAQLGDLRLGVLASAMVLFFPGLGLLGTMGPFVIRLITLAPSRVGRTSGLVFAISTVGSLLAALVTGFFLIPNFGVRTILVCTSAALVLVAMAGNPRPRFLLVALLLAGAASGVAIWGEKSRPEWASVDVRDHVQSFYGSLHVIGRQDQVALLLDGIGQNYFQVNGSWTTPYISFLAAVPGMSGMLDGTQRRGLVIGLGAGQLPMLLETAGLQASVVEIDSRIGQLASKHFGFSLPAERVHYLDGRQFLAWGDDVFDYIVLDAFNGEQVPWHLISREALALARRRLAPDGILAINLTSVESSRDVAALQQTLLAVFPHVRAFAGNEGAGLAGFEFLAANHPLVLNPAQAGDGAGRAEDVARHLSNELQNLDGGLVLTDDFNPVNEYRREINQLWRGSMRDWLGGDLEWLLF